MAYQKAENFKFEGKYSEFIPAASTAIAAGDAVMLARDAGTITVMTATPEGARTFVGISDDVWSSTVATQKYGAGNTDYTSPTTRPVKLKVYNSGVFDLAINETSGYAGQAVWLKTATTGSQVFTCDPASTAGTALGGPIGYLYENFSGATQYDCQKVRIAPNVGSPISPDIRWFMMNRPISMVASTGNMEGSMPFTGVDSKGGSTLSTRCAMMFMVQGEYISIGSGVELGAQCHNTADASTLCIVALGSDGSVYLFKDYLKGTTGETFASMVAAPAYWPSVSLDYFPFAMVCMGATGSYYGSVSYFYFRSYSDLLRVS